MSFKQKLLERKAKPVFLTLEVEGVGEMDFQVGSITLGQLINHTKTYPSLNSLINGIKLDEGDAEDNLEKMMEVLEAFNVIVALAVQFKDGKNWVAFSLDAETENALIPGEVLPQATLLELGQAVVKNFRAGR